MSRILVTGGAGYIGSVAAKALLDKGFEVIIIDNLSKGKMELVDKRATFYEVDLTDESKLYDVLKQHNIDAVMHFAGYKAVNESMADAIKYSDNISGTINLLNSMVKLKIKKIIFSSSAAVYGSPKKIPIEEEDQVNAMSFYGYTKLNAETLMEWYSSIYGIEYVSLRYFNVVGDAGFNYIDPEAQNVLPLIMEVIAGKREKFVITGDDYDTRDGTGVRDYLDVTDIANAHVLALDAKHNGPINLGTSDGISVKELVKMTEEVTGKELKCEVGPRRDGDIAMCVASNKKAKEILGWEPKVDIKESIRSTYEAYFNGKNK